MNIAEKDYFRLSIFQRFREAIILTASRSIVIIIDNDNNSCVYKKGEI